MTVTDANPRLRAMAIGILFLAVILGARIADDYGVSADEHLNIAAGKAALAAYRGPTEYRDYIELGDPVAHHGPAYFMIYYLGAEGFSKLFPQWHPTAGRHFTNYLVYLLGLVAFYSLARRYLERAPSLATTLFFGTQPLLFGHAFINQKDTPFLVFFTASVVLGWWAADRASSAHRLTSTHVTGSSPLALGKDEVRGQPRWKHLISAIMILLAVFLIVDVLWLERGIRGASALIAAAHKGESVPLINSLYKLVAEDAYKTPASVYQSKLVLVYWIVRPAIFVLASLGLAFVSFWNLPSLARRRLPVYRRAIGPTLMAAVTLGATLSVRPIGAFAGLLILIYWISKDRLRSLDLLLLFGILTMGVMYITWPFLWESPTSRLLDSVQFTGSFDKINLYFGRIITGEDLPWHYFPALALLTLTEPFAPLLIGGLTAFGYERQAFRAKLVEISLLVMWIVVPLFGLIGLGIGIYGNIRHLHFTLVPLFIFAGIAIQWSLKSLRRAGLQAAFVGLLLFPGVVGIARLHPYEYSYFNSFIGGPSGASGEFTLDRWCISYREAMEFVEGVATRGDVVAALYSPPSAAPFTPEGVEVAGRSNWPVPEARFMLTCAFKLGEYSDDPDWNLIFRVERVGATLAEVYERAGDHVPSEAD